MCVRARALARMFINALQMNTQQRVMLLSGKKHFLYEVEESVVVSYLFFVFCYFWCLCILMHHRCISNRAWCCRVEKRYIFSHRLSYMLFLLLLLLILLFLKFLELILLQ